MVFRCEVTEGFSVQKGMMAVPRGRDRRRRDFVDSTSGREIRASVIPKIEMFAELNR